MAYDDRNERARWRDHGCAAASARPQRLGDRDWRERRRPRLRPERYGGSARRRRWRRQRLRPDQRTRMASFGASAAYDASFAGSALRSARRRADTGTHGVHPAFVAARRRLSSARAASRPAGGYVQLGAALSPRSAGRAMHDPHYAEWRSRQIDELDRDYDEYRRENQSAFDSEFGGWREQRGEQAPAARPGRRAYGSGRPRRRACRHGRPRRAATASS